MPSTVTLQSPIPCSSKMYYYAQHVSFLAHLSWKLKWAFLIICKLFLFLTSSQDHWDNFNQTWHKASFKFLQMKGLALFQGEIITKKRKYINIKNLLLQNHWVNTRWNTTIQWKLKGAIQSPFSHHSVTELQVHFSDHSVPFSHHSFAFQ